VKNYLIKNILTFVTRITISNLTTWWCGIPCENKIFDYYSAWWLIHYFGQPLQLIMIQSPMMMIWHLICQQDDVTICQHHDSYHWCDELARRVYVCYNESLLWETMFFSLGTFYSNACGD
jgi:hypothetical protein